MPATKPRIPYPGLTSVESKVTLNNSTFAPMAISNREETDTFYEQFDVFQAKPLKGDIVIWMRDLNAKVSSVNILLRLMMGRHSLGNCNKVKSGNRPYCTYQLKSSKRLVIVIKDFAPGVVSNDFAPKSICNIINRNKI